MKRIKLMPALLVVASTIVASDALASPYQFQISAGVNKSEADIDFFTVSETVESDGVVGSFIYYFAPVDSAVGPLVQKPFLAKSSSLEIVYGNETVNNNTQEFDVTTTALKAQHVATNDYIFEFTYAKSEADQGAGDDDPSIGLGIGKYLSEDSTAIFRVLQLDSDTTLITGSKKTFVAGNGSSSTVFEGGLGLINVDSTTGFQFNMNGQYYFSESLSVGAGLVYQNIDGGDSQTLSLNADYFVTEKIFVAANFLKLLVGSTVDTNSFVLTAGARF